MKWAEQEGAGNASVMPHWMTCYKGAAKGQTRHLKGLPGKSPGKYRGSAEVKSKSKMQMDDLVRSIGELAKAGNQLARQAEQQYVPEVEDVLRTQCRDPNRIERLLDGILDFCFDLAMPRLYKKLCRYCSTIDPEATVSYVNACRKMWNENSGNLEGEE
jgi:hypothetical protein